MLGCFASQPGQAQQASGDAFDQAFADLSAPIPQTESAAEAESRPLGEGMASYYADRFHGRRTASGESFDKFALTAAPPTLPFGSLVRVTNPRNGQIGRAACRESVCPYVYIPVVAVTLKQQKKADK